MAKIKLHRCPFTFLRTDRDACWKVQSALDEQGIDYEIVKQPTLPRSRRKEVERLSWTVSEICRQVRLISAPFCGHRRRCRPVCGRG
jgi:hypothetical protein